MFGKIDDDMTLQQSMQKKRSAYMLKPRGKAPQRFTPEDCVARKKKVVVDFDDEPPRRSALRRMRNDEEQEEEEPEQEEEEEPHA